MAGLGLIEIFVHSQGMGRKLEGIKQLQELTKNVRYQQNNTQISGEELLQWIWEQKVWEVIFGSQGHVEFIQRSDDLLALAFRTYSKDMSGDHTLTEIMDIIWVGTNSDIDTKIEIFNLIKGNVYMLSNLDKYSVLQKLQGIECGEFHLADVQLVYDLTRTIARDNKHSLGLDMLWNITCQYPYIYIYIYIYNIYILCRLECDEKVVTLSLEKLIEALKFYELEPHKLRLFEKSVKQIKEVYYLYITHRIHILIIILCSCMRHSPDSLQRLLIRLNQ